MVTYAQPEIVAVPSHLLGLDGLSEAGFGALLDLAAVMKRHALAWRSALKGRAIACLFEQPSTRTRVSLEVAIHRLGALPVMLRPEELRLADVDSLAQTARLLSSYCDAIAVRTPRHRDLLELAEHTSVPVLNAGTDREHPCRVLADCLTLRERFGDLRGLPIAYLGDRDAVADSLIEAAILSRIELRIAAPPALLPDPGLLARAGQTVRICETPSEAVRDAVAVYAANPPRELLSLAAPGAVLMTARGPAPHTDVLGDPGSQHDAGLLGIHQAVLRGLVTGDWEV
jgi:ornithine carbamoyltransferase